MKKIILFLVAATAIQWLTAQNISFERKSSEILRTKGRVYGMKAIGFLDEHAFFLFEPHATVFAGPSGIGSLVHYSIGKVDKEANLINQSTLIFDRKRKKIDFEGARVINNKLVVFYSFQNDAKKKHYLFSRSVNTETLELEDDTRMMAELDYSGIGRYKSTAMQHEVSEDGTKIMFFYSVLSNKGETLRFTVQVFDNEFNLIWRNNVMPKFDAGVFKYKQFRVDNNADVYLLGTHFTDRKNYYESAKFGTRSLFSKSTYFTDVPNFTFQLYKYSGKGTKEEYRDIKLESKFIRSMNFSVRDETVQINGIYSNPQTISARGSFSFCYDVSSGRKTALSSMEFAAGLLEQGLGDRQLKQFRRSIDNQEEYDPFDYAVGDVKTLSDGSKYYTAEQYILGTKKVANGGYVTYTTVYVHGDVFVIRLKSDGTTGTIEKISKRQYNQSTARYNSFIDLERNGSLYFIYNTITGRETVLGNDEAGEMVISKVNNGIETEVCRPLESFRIPLMLPTTHVEFPDGSIIYGILSPKFTKFGFERIDVK